MAGGASSFFERQVFMSKLKYYGSLILFFIVVGALGFGTSYVQRPHNVVIGVNLALSGEEKAYGEATALSLIHI